VSYSARSKNHVLGPPPRVCNDTQPLNGQLTLHESTSLLVFLHVRSWLPNLLPAIFLVVFAITRWPGLLPENFSAAYALMFCAGVFFSGRWAWFGAMGVLLATDLILSAYYQWGRGYSVFTSGTLLYLGLNYLGYAILILLGRCFKSTSPLLALLSGGLLGAILFYLLTNTGAWLFNPFKNPEYTLSLSGWIRALTLGTSGFPETWTFFRNTLLSSALFTFLFSAVHQWTAAESPAEKEEAEHPGQDPEAEPEEA